MTALVPSYISKLQPWEMLFVPDEGESVDVGRGIVDLPNSSTYPGDDIYMRAVKKAYDL